MTMVALSVNHGGLEGDDDVDADSNCSVLTSYAAAAVIDCTWNMVTVPSRSSRAASFRLVVGRHNWKARLGRR